MGGTIELVSGILPVKIVQNTCLHSQGLLAGERKAMFSADLWRPTPQISGIAKCRNTEEIKRGGGYRRKEQRVLACDHGSMLPIEAQAGSLQTNDAEVNGVAGRRKSSGKVELDVGGSFCAGQVGSEDFKSNFRLSHGGPKTRLGRARRNGLGKVGEVQTVGGSNVAKGVQEHDAGKPGAVFGGRFYFGLILLINPRAQQRCRLFELLNPIL